MTLLRFILATFFINSAFAEDFQSLQQKFQTQSGRRLLELSSQNTIFDCHSYRANEKALFLEQFIFAYVRFSQEEDLQFSQMKDLRGVHPSSYFATADEIDGIKTFIYDTEWAFRSWDENPKYLIIEHKDASGEPDFYSMCFPGMLFPEP